MKKLILIAALGLVAFSSFAQSGTRIRRFLPLLSGYNVLVQTNAGGTAVGLGTTNVLYTKYNGQVVYSLTNNVINGTLFTNGIFGDAFQLAGVASDALGDFTANAAIVVYIGNTNWIPLVTTNSVGQYIIPPQGFTNASITTAYAGWPLATSQYPNWQYPATTNYYPTFTAASTNVVTITLYKVATTKPQGGLGADLGPNFNIAETTGTFTFTVTPTGLTPYCLITNLSASFLQGAGDIYCTVSTALVSANNNNSILINQIGLLQPQP